MTADWDDAAVRSRHGHVLQSAAWGALRERQGWQAEHLRVGDPLPVALLLWRTLPAGQRFGYVPRGPVFDHDDPAQLDAALAAIARRARERGAIFIKVDAEVPRDRADLLAAYARHGFGRSPQEVQYAVATLEIDLRRDEDAIFADFDKDTRWSIRTAERRGVQVAERSDDAALEEFRALYAETGERVGFITRPPAYYLSVWRTLVDVGHGTLFLASHEGRAVAGALLFWCGDRGVYMYGASDDAARRTYAGYLLQWHCIRAARARGCARYDLGGIPPVPVKQERLYGLYLFKKGFGGARRDFAGAHDVVSRPLLYRLWSAAAPRISAARAALRGSRARVR